MRLCEFLCLEQGTLAREFSDRRFCVRVVDLFTPASCSTSHGELASELPGDDAKLGVAMAEKFSPEGLLHGAVRAMVLFRIAVGLTKRSMSDF